MSTIGALNSEERLAAIDRYDILDTPVEEAFDRITRLVCRLLKVRISTVTFIDGHRQWFKSRQGLASQETAREPAFCQIPVAEGRALVVTDTLEDSRFRDNAFVRGEPHLRAYAGVPIRGAERTIVGTLCAMDTEPHPFTDEEVERLADLAKLVESELELRLLATIDPVTQALSRRAFRTEAERAVALALRHKYDLCCIFFDLDHFKSINDSAGHATGDAVLEKTAQTCQALLRKSDLFGRLGGEEFAIILPHTGPVEGLGVAEKLRKAIENQLVKGPAGAVRVTASFGVAAVGPTPLNVDSLISRADEAMYRAKMSGRNRSLMWQGSEADPIGLTRRVLKAGSIVFNQGNSTINCTVRRLSDRGATLDMVTSDGVPRRFKLNIPADNFSHACTISVKSEKRLEVVFD